MASRTIICDDALSWLVRPQQGAVVTGLPDAAEVGLDAAAYISWFATAVRGCLQARAPGQPAVFCQTDRKHAGVTISKLHIMHLEADKVGLNLLWHKVVLRRDVGRIDLHRPGYSHLAAFGDSDTRPGKATPDVLPCSKALYGNGMPLLAADTAVQLAVANGATRVVDPFCGYGTVPALAWGWYDLEAVGVDIDPAQCARAEALHLPKPLA